MYVYIHASSCCTTAKKLDSNIEFYVQQPISQQAICEGVWRAIETGRPDRYPGKQAKVIYV